MSLIVTGRREQINPSNLNKPLCPVCKYNGNKKYSNCLTWHHIVPKKAGGSDSRKNLFLICRICHDTWHRFEADLEIQGLLKSKADYAAWFKDWLLVVLRNNWTFKTTIKKPRRVSKTLNKLRQKVYMESLSNKIP